MPVDYSGILACTWGTSTIQLEGYKVQVQPAVQEGQGRTGTKVTVDLDGYVDGTSATDFADRVRALHDDLSASARDLIVTGVGGGLLLAVTTAQSLDGGPHAKLTSSQPGEVPLRQRVAFSVEADLVMSGPGGSGGNPPLDTYEVRTRTKPDDLDEVERSGEMNGIDTPTYLLTVAVPAFWKAYPLPNWVTEYEYTKSGGGVSKLKYRMTARELFQPLPAGKKHKDGTRDHAVDGDATITVDLDEQNGKTTTYDLDLLVDGDAAALAAEIRAGILVGAVGFGLGVAGRPDDDDPYYTGGDGTRPGQAAQVKRQFLKERVQITQVIENRVRAQFVVLESADNSLLLTWSSSMETADPARTVELKTYVGAAPVPVRPPAGLPQVTVSGTALCEGLFLVPPEAPYPFHAQEPVVTFEYVDRIKRKTTWRYVMYPLDDKGAVQKPQLAQWLYYKAAYLDRPATGDLKFAP